MAGIVWSRAKKRIKVGGLLVIQLVFVLSSMFSVPLVPVAARGTEEVDPRQHTW
jgi:hypothetical protein